MSAKSFVQQKRRLVTVVGALSVVLVAGAIGGAAIAMGGDASPSPARPQQTATATATAFPVATPPPEPTVDPQKRQQLLPFGPVAADPVRVFTGDGDCLNVRPQPGTTFATDPRACVPEGFLLWLYGPEQNVDNEVWRYALGEGWVAIRYVKPDTTLNPGFGSLKSVLVSQMDGVETFVASVQPSGSAKALAALQYVPQGIGSTPPRVSLSGVYAAFDHPDNYAPSLVITRLADGAETRYPKAYAVEWGAGDRLLVRVSANCPNTCTWVTGWLDPKEGVIHTFEHQANDWNNVAWMPDGESFIAITQARSVLRVYLDERIETVTADLGEDNGFGQISVSPDGSKLLSGATIGPIRVLDLRTGKVSEIPRAAQLPVGGRCGGATGRLSTWLDSSTAIWHESYAAKGNNGITIASAAGGARRVLPFFSIQGLSVVGPNLVSFSTYESMGQTGFMLSWLLDTKSGEARPVTVGADPIWIS
ncbi:MAG: WD40 repeat domain-containing protein [Gammaproteobacteria bacterium]